MGEYAKIGGIPIKLGTCEEMFYVRRDEIERLPFQSEPHSIGKTDLLGPAKLFFRFPWPDEDNDTAQDIANRDYAPSKALLEVPRGFADRIPHGHKVLGFTPREKPGANVNVAVPCPAALRLRPKDAGATEAYCVSPVERIYVRPIADHWEKGHNWTTFGCPLCEHRFSLDETVVAVIQSHAREVVACSPSNLQAVHELAVAERIVPFPAALREAVA